MWRGDEVAGPRLQRRISSQGLLRGDDMNHGGRALHVRRGGNKEEDERKLQNKEKRRIDL
jgi:hypothetical protein